MESYESRSTINATPAQVWTVLADAATWPDWDSGVTKVEGTIESGAKLKVTTAASPDRTFPVKVTDVRPDSGMTFVGGMPLGLFRGERTYSLTSTSDSTTEFRMREEYTGLMLPLIWKSMPDLQPSFDQFAAGLKKRVEGGA
ncbi:SRPBCC family protein [Actinokineospora sp. HUAS TT18]|uniref:SRPBCC family protein n=1 Tax=Actinokineospora sp. HUAS TT18 TaxID=3447451 RepID=UPI003F52057A